MSSASAQPHVLREYALLADGERGAIVGPRGDIAWLCFPRWDGDALFASLIGGGGGYVVEPAERYVWGGHYAEGTLIWNSRWVTTSGVVECREALALPSMVDRAVVLRRIISRSGPARMRIRLEVCWDYGRRQAEDVRRDACGAWHIRAGDVRLHWTGAERAEPVCGPTGALGFDLVLDEGGQHDLVLAVERGGGDAAGTTDPARLWAETETEWRPRGATPGTRSRCSPA
jgi:hypothetical protein